MFNRHRCSNSPVYYYHSSFIDISYLTDYILFFYIRSLGNGWKWQAVVERLLQYCCTYIFTIHTGVRNEMYSRITQLLTTIIMWNYDLLYRSLESVCGTETWL